MNLYNLFVYSILRCSSDYQIRNENEDSLDCNPMLLLLHTCTSCQNSEFYYANKCEHLIKELDEFKLIHDDVQSKYYKTENLPTIRHRNRRDGDNHDDHDDDHEDDHDDHEDHSHSDHDPEASTPSPDKDSTWTTAQKWGYATLANSILGEIQLI